MGMCSREFNLCKVLFERCDLSSGPDMPMCILNNDDYMPENSTSDGVMGQDNFEHK